MYTNNSNTEMNIKTSNILENTKLSELKGIGEKTEKLFGKVGINNLGQLIHYYPRAYDYHAACVRIGELKLSEKQAVKICVRKAPIVKRGGRVDVTILNAEDETGRLEAIWYNMPYLRAVLKIGTEAVLRGIVTEKNGRRCMEHPEVYTMQAYTDIQGSIQPIYSLTSGLKNKTVAKAVHQVFDKYEFGEYLPDEMLAKYSLTSRQDALVGIHFPRSGELLHLSRERIVFDEFLFFLLKLASMSENAEKIENTHKINDFSISKKVLHNLGFELTDAQNRAWHEICDDISSDCVMNRLLQGDVGSGKTIVAFLAALCVIDAGFQCAIMAPTEILAEQHYETFIKLLKNNSLSDDGVVLLTGSLSAADKRAAHEAISDGSAKVVIGTHAIIQKSVNFKNLGLVVTDEQHRFGVMQRKNISEKGDAPHVLVMSATPIPRTLAIILYGDLKISVLDELPAKRLKIKNCVVDTSYRKTAYSFIKREIDKGRQAYIICPMIEPNEDLGCENVIEYAKKIRKIFGNDINIGVLHGRMKAAEKTQVMESFAKNEIQILVSTTVVEVGIDVPNATVMLIENAERFGLAQLHQLRGRIGRGVEQSYCIFMQSGNEKNDRLEILNSSNDGFYIAREDLKLRGQGDLFGLRQSGEAGFSLADPLADGEILKKASDAVKEIIKDDPSLSSEKYSRLAIASRQISTDVDGIL